VGHYVGESDIVAEPGARRRRSFAARETGSASRRCAGPTTRMVFFTDTSAHADRKGAFITITGENTSGADTRTTAII